MIVISEIDFFAPKTFNFLIEKANYKKLTTFGETADNIGKHHVEVNRILWQIGNFCLRYKYPPIIAIVVRKDTNKPGKILWRVFAEVQEHEKDKRWEEMCQEVFSYDWKQVPKELLDKRGYD